MRKAHIIFGFVLTTTPQGTGAPFVDQCGGKTINGKNWTGYAILLKPWRRDQYGERAEGLALCIGRVGRKWPVATFKGVQQQSNDQCSVAPSA